MKKQLLALLLFTFSSTLFASGWEFLPVANSDYDPAIAMALSAGIVKDSESDKNVTAYGFEVSFACPLLKPPTNRIRQQLSVTLVNNDDSDTDLTLIELNPHYMFQINESFEAGFGANLGMGLLKIIDDNEAFYMIGVGASARYDINEMFFVGAEARYGWTTDVKVGNFELDFNNVKAIGKVGFQF